MKHPEQSEREVGCGVCAFVVLAMPANADSTVAVWGLNPTRAAPQPITEVWQIRALL